MAPREGVELVKDACGIQGIELSSGENVVDSYGVVTTKEPERKKFKEIVELKKDADNFVDAYAYAISQHKNFQREMDGLSAMVAY